jgi:hypothetical protein
MTLPLLTALMSLQLSAPKPAPKGFQTLTVQERAGLSLAAARFFDALMNENLTELTTLCKSSFSFDGRMTTKSEEMKRRWADLLALREGRKVKLYDIEILPLAGVIAKYGPAPKRLEPLPKNAFVAIGNLSGRATVVVFVKGDAGWQAVALHD